MAMYGTRHGVYLSENLDSDDTLFMQLDFDGDFLTRDDAERIIAHLQKAFEMDTLTVRGEPWHEDVFGENRT